MANGKVSYSELQVWNRCQWQWFLVYRCDVGKPLHTVHMTFGTHVHFAFEATNPPRKKLKEGVAPLSLDEAVAKFSSEFPESYEKIKDVDPKPATPEQVAEMVKAGERIIRGFSNVPEITKSEIMFIEHKLFEPIDRTDGVEYKFKGYIDIVLKTVDKRGRPIVYIVDMKTCSWGWPREKLQDENVLAQLRLYKHFFSKKFKVDPDLVKTAFFLLKKRPKDVAQPNEWKPISSGDKTTLRAVEKLNAAVTGMESNDYKKNRSACIDSFGHACQFLGTKHCPND